MWLVVSRVDSDHEQLKVLWWIPWSSPPESMLCLHWKSHASSAHPTPRISCPHVSWPSPMTTLTTPQRHSPPPGVPCLCGALLGTSSFPPSPPHTHTTEVQGSVTPQDFFWHKGWWKPWINCSHFPPPRFQPGTQFPLDSSKFIFAQAPRIQSFESLKPHSFSIVS